MPRKILIGVLTVLGVACLGFGVYLRFGGVPVPKAGEPLLTVNRVRSDGTALAVSYTHKTIEGNEVEVSVDVSDGYALTYAYDEDLTDDEGMFFVVSRWGGERLRVGFFSMDEFEEERANAIRNSDNLVVSDVNGEFVYKTGQTFGGYPSIIAMIKIDGIEDMYAFVYGSEDFNPKYEVTEDDLWDAYSHLHIVAKQ